MWLGIPLWTGARLHGVHRVCARTAAVLRGTSHTSQPISTKSITSVGTHTHYIKPQSLTPSHATRAMWQCYLYVNAQSIQASFRICDLHWTTRSFTGGPGVTPHYSASSTWVAMATSQDDLNSPAFSTKLASFNFANICSNTHEMSRTIWHYTLPSSLQKYIYKWTGPFHSSIINVHIIISIKFAEERYMNRQRRVFPQPWTML